MTVSMVYFYRQHRVYFVDYTILHQTILYSTILYYTTYLLFASCFTALQFYQNLLQVVNIFPGLKVSINLHNS